MTLISAREEINFYSAIEKLKNLGKSELAGLRTNRHGVKAMKVDYASPGELGKILEFQDDNNVLVQFARGKNVHKIVPYGGLEIFIRRLDANSIPGTDGMRPMDLVNTYLLFRRFRGNLETFHKEYMSLFGEQFGYR